jgi:hypothetical protein
VSNVSRDTCDVTWLMTTDAHCHVLTADCPLACLDGLLSNQALNPLVSLMREPSGRGSVAEVVEWYRHRRLGELPGIGVGRIAEIEEVLLAAGLVDRSECYTLAGSAPAVAVAWRWIVPIDGPLVREMRVASGFSQSLLARLAGLSVSTIARLENQAVSFCHGQTLERLDSGPGLAGEENVQHVATNDTSEALAISSANHGNGIRSGRVPQRWPGD